MGATLPHVALSAARNGPLSGPHLRLIELHARHQAAKLVRVLTFSHDPDIAEQQMHALIFYLTAFGYIDGDFDFAEKNYVRAHIRKLIELRAHAAMPDEQAAVRDEVVEKFTAHFHEVFEQTDYSIRDLFSEAISDGEDVEAFVYAKLKLRSYEIFQSFDGANQRALLATLDELIHADGNVHPAEAKFRHEIEALLETEVQVESASVEVEEFDVVATEVAIAQPIALTARLEDHPFFAEFEEHYSADPEELKRQAAYDAELIRRFGAQLVAQRQGGTGKLAGVHYLGELDGAAPFLDGHIYHHPAHAERSYELFVLGDLHGCYSCLKSAVLQADFFAKLEAWKLNPALPEPKLILLGDYIDRGRFSYNGVLRTVMQLYLAAPDHVYVLRGNHEYYVEYRGRIYGGVKPAEAINTLWGHMPDAMFAQYMALFEQMPSILFFGRLMFVHAGIPRERDLKAKFHDLASLNDPELRFQMLWSDPSTADVIPEELQAQNARFPFGRKQYEAFMQRIGAKLFVRGHEKIDEGFRTMYADGPAPLLNLFSAGGTDNADLPTDSSYRSVTPMAATILVQGERYEIKPWRIEYRRFNDPRRNRFFASAPQIEHRAE